MTVDQAASDVSADVIKKWTGNSIAADIQNYKSWAGGNSPMPGGGAHVPPRRRFT